MSRDQYKYQSKDRHPRPIFAVRRGSRPCGRRGERNHRGHRDHRGREKGTGSRAELGGAVVDHAAGGEKETTEDTETTEGGRRERAVGLSWAARSSTMLPEGRKNHREHRDHRGFRRRGLGRTHWPRNPLAQESCHFEPACKGRSPCRKQACLPVGRGEKSLTMKQSSSITDFVVAKR